MKLNLLAESGEYKPVIMGCYGFWRQSLYPDHHRAAS